MKVVGYSLMLMFAVVCIWAPVAEADWSHDPEANNAVCTASGGQSQVQVVDDGAGGHIAVWVDARAGDSDIYAQRVDATGVVTWTAGGVAVCGAAGEQDSPRVVSDGAGGAIVVWRDGRSGSDTDVYAQRIDASGAFEWVPDGVGVCTVVADQDGAVLAPDGLGGAYIAWEDHRTDAADEDVYAQLVGLGGSVQWAPGGIALSDTTGAQRSLAITCRNSGGAVVAWSDDRASDGGIYAVRINLFGAALWSSATSLIDGGATHWDHPAIMPDGWGGAFIVCEGTMGSDELDVLGQRVNASGDVLWGSGGATVCSAAGDQYAVQLVADDAGGAILVWNDERTGLSTDIYSLRIDGWGASQWPMYPLGLAVSGGLDDAGPPDLVADGAGGAVVAWHGGQPDHEDIFAQRFDDGGAILWSFNGEIVSSAFGRKWEPKVASDGAGGGVVVWCDFRNASDFDVYAQRMERNGYLGYPAAEITTIRDHPDDQGGQMVTSWSPSYLDVWPRDEVGYYSVWRRYAGITRGALPVQSFPWYLDPRDPAALERDGWAYVGQVQSYQLPEYSLVVPTYGDSTDAGIIWTDVMVMAHSYIPDDCWISEAVAGYSIDNWAPGTPDSLKAVAVWVDVSLTWSPSEYRDEDLSHYDIHRSDTSGFTPDASTLIGSPSDTAFVDVDPGEGTWYYRAVAEDVHGNESGPSAEAWVALGTGVGDSELSSVLTIRGNSPNPFNPTTSIEYDLPESGRVRLDVFSAAGDFVATVERGFREAGRHEVVWTGTDAAGRALPSGVYFARLEAGEKTAVHKMVLLK